MPQLHEHTEEWRGDTLIIDGQSFAEWAAELFEFELCHECGRDVADHAPAVVLGHWFALCTTLDGAL
jgi:hypothetical protein